MFDTGLLLHLLGIHLLMAMLPGPNTVVVSHSSAALSRRAGLMAALGVACASLVWLVLSLAGISLILLEAGGLYRWARLAGAAYLIYVGIRLLRTSAPSADTTPSGPSRSPFLAGALTTFSNPKSAVFWTSVFSVVLPSGIPISFHALIVVLISMQAFAWYALVALAFSTPFSRRQYERLTLVMNRVAGVVMIFFGIRIVAELRREFLARG